jgi:protein-S-isoprenylcysteine O-methyltransferase Ste14
MNPIVASGWLWGAWVVSWILAAAWNRRVVARPAFGARALDIIPTAIGALLLAYAARVRQMFSDAELGPRLLWQLSAPMAWALTLAVAAGFAFTWWARLTLGDLWSSSVTRKEGHVVVEAGPYGLVRHPIYTGLILSALALAIQLGLLAGLLGAALMALGFSIKARLEERFLSAELGEDAYADYRRRTPMLVPFWPMRG